MRPVRIIIRLIGVLALIYIFLSITFLEFHTKIIFRPDKLSRDYSFKFDQPFDEYFIPVTKEVEINALLFRSGTKPKGLLLYFHGNKDNLQRWGTYASDFTQLGYDVLMMDYRGYGKSGGKPGEQEMYHDAALIFQWAQQTFSYPNIIFYGRSLGSAIASNLAVMAEPDLLILETPFDELWGVVYPVFLPTIYLVKPKYQFSNADHIRLVKCKKLLIQGSSDWVVPLSSALRLKPFLKPGDEFVIIEGGGHNNLHDFPEYQRALKRALP